MVTARAFRPPSSGLFGQADRAAALELTSTAMGLLQRLSDEEIAVDDSNQVANAMAALEAERGRLNQYMDDHPNDARQWGQWFAGEQEGIRGRVMSGVTTPGASRRVSNALTETLAGWSVTVAERRRGQIIKNSYTDFNTRHQAYRTQSTTFQDEEDFIRSVSEALANIEDAATHDPETGRPPLIREEEAIERRREVAIQMIGDRVLQNALQAPDEKTARAEVESTNELASDFGLPADTFGPEEIEALYTRYAKHMNAIEAEDNALRTARAEQFINTMNLAIRDGKLIGEDGVSIEHHIRTNEDLKASQRNALLGAYDAKAEAMAKAKKEPTPEEWMSSMLRYYAAKGREEKIRVLHEIAGTIGETKYKQLFTDLMEDKPDDPYEESLLTSGKTLENLLTGEAELTGKTPGETAVAVGTASHKAGTITKAAVDAYRDRIEKGDDGRKALETGQAIMIDAYRPVTKGLLRRFNDWLWSIHPSPEKWRKYGFAPVATIPTPPIVKSQEDYDALAPGTEFINFKTAKRMRKPE